MCPRELNHGSSNLITILELSKTHKKCHKGKVYGSCEVREWKNYPFDFFEIHLTKGTYRGK